MDKKEFISTALNESSSVKHSIIEKCSDDIVSAVDLLKKTIRGGRKILLCGNGGSAADAQHIAAEFIVRLSHDVERPAIPAIAITTDSSLLTAGGNDIGFENVFARTVEGLGNSGDVLIAISTSGNSENIIKAVKKAHEKNMICLGLTGGSGGKLKDLVDLSIIIPSSSVQRIQEGHITVAHIICELVELELYN